MSTVGWVVLVVATIWAGGSTVAFVIILGIDRHQNKFNRHVEQALKVVEPTGDFWCERCADLVHDPLNHLKEHAED